MREIPASRNKTGNLQKLGSIHLKFFHIVTAPILQIESEKNETVVLQHLYLTRVLTFNYLPPGNLKMSNYYHFYLIFHLREGVTVAWKANNGMLVKEDFPQEKQIELQVAKLFTFQAQIMKSEQFIYCYLLSLLERKLN